MEFRLQKSIFGLYPLLMSPSVGPHFPHKPQDGTGAQDMKFDIPHYNDAFNLGFGLG